MKRFLSEQRSIKYSWKSLCCVTYLSVSLYFFMEWLFIITKPSFFSPIGLFYKKVETLIFSSSIFTSLCFCGVLLLFAAGSLPWSKNARRVCLILGSFIPVMVVTSLALLLIDNFTYTLFKFGIISTRGFLRFLYLIGFILMFIYFYDQIGKASAWLTPRLEHRSWSNGIVPALTILVGACVLITYQPKIPNTDLSNSTGLSSSNELPNIILITADGLDASHTSLYGYERNTTPRMADLAKSALVAENSFTNVGNTAGSLIAIYTSKYATQTRVLYPPDILKNQDSYQHLPGILHSLGYYTAQYSIKDYGDAYTQNLLEGFDVSNGQTILQSRLFAQLSQYLQTDDAYFISEVSNRISDRLRHIFFNTVMVNRYALVQGIAQMYNDKYKLDSLFTLLDQSQQPLFVHIHWMGTHGTRFTPKNRTYSKDKNINKQQLWDDDFYDDTIIDFDNGVGEIIDKLIASDKLDDTILIIGSDHGEKYMTIKKIPLVMRFPNGQYAGSIEENTQNLDIAPTVLNYMGIDKPTWMEGDSLLSGSPGNRPIYGVGVGNVTIENAAVVAQSMKPPFYQFGFISVVYCDRWYQLNLGNMEWTNGEIIGYTGSCQSEAEVTNQQVFRWMADRLKKDGFDTTKLTDFSVVIPK
jgi:hypothetical protein